MFRTKPIMESVFLHPVPVKPIIPRIIAVINDKGNSPQLVAQIIHIKPGGISVLILSVNIPIMIPYTRKVPILSANEILLILGFFFSTS